MKTLKRVSQTLTPPLTLKEVFSEIEGPLVGLLFLHPDNGRTLIGDVNEAMGVCGHCYDTERSELPVIAIEVLL